MNIKTAKFHFLEIQSHTTLKENVSKSMEDKGDREGIPHTHPITYVTRLELFLTPQISRGIRQQPIT